MRVWDGVKERSKKKLVHGLVMWKQLGDDKLAESRCPESGGKLEAATKTEIAMGDCLKSDLERVGEEWKI